MGFTGNAMPGFVVRATNTWSIEPVGAHASRLPMKIEMAMGSLMSIGIGNLLRTNLEELKYYIETGEPPRTQTVEPGALMVFIPIGRAERAG